MCPRHLSEYCLCMRYSEYDYSVRRNIVRLKTSCKEEKSVMKNIVAFVKLDKDQRAMRKAGIVDDNGNLTEDGKTVMLGIMAEEHKAKLAEYAREYLKEDKEDKK